MILDILAYVVLGLFLIFGVAPVIGDSMLGGVNSYSDSLKAGMALAVTVIAFAVIMGSILWALSQVGWF